MSPYLTIPEIVDSEPLHSVSPDPNGLTFRAVLDVTDTAVRLMHAHEQGEHIPLVVLTTDGGIIALDSVYVGSVVISTQPSQLAEVELVAQAVRFV